MIYCNCREQHGRIFQAPINDAMAIVMSSMWFRVNGSCVWDPFLPGAGPQVTGDFFISNNMDTDYRNPRLCFKIMTHWAGKAPPVSTGPRPGPQVRPVLAAAGSSRPSLGSPLSLPSLSSRAVWCFLLCHPDLSQILIRNNGIIYSAEIRNVCTRYSGTLLTVVLLTSHDHDQSL